MTEFVRQRLVGEAAERRHAEGNVLRFGPVAEHQVRDAAVLAVHAHHRHHVGTDGVSQRVHPVELTVVGGGESPQVGPEVAAHVIGLGLHQQVQARVDAAVAVARVGSRDGGGDLSFDGGLATGRCARGSGVHHQHVDGSSGVARSQHAGVDQSAFMRMHQCLGGCTRGNLGAGRQAVDIDQFQPGPGLRRDDAPATAIIATQETAHRFTGAAPRQHAAARFGRVARQCGRGPAIVGASHVDDREPLASGRREWCRQWGADHRFRLQRDLFLGHHTGRRGGSLSPGHAARHGQDQGFNGKDGTLAHGSDTVPPESACSK